MIAKRVLTLLSDILSMDEDDLNPAMPLVGSRDIESLDLAKLIVECERTFKITIEDEDVHRFFTLGDLIAYIEMKRD